MQEEEEIGTCMCGCVCVCVCVRVGVCVQAPQGVRDVTVRVVHVCVRACVRTIYICSRRRKGFVT